MTTFDDAARAMGAQEPSDAEILAALNAHLVALTPTANLAPSLNYYHAEHVTAMRSALRAAARVRKGEDL